MLGGGGQIPGTLDAGIDAPADTGASHPATNAIQIVFHQTEAPPHRRRLQQAQHLLGVMAPTAQIQQFEKYLDQRILDRRTLIGNAERYPPFARDTVEHRLDQRPVHGDVRRHHDHVRRLQIPPRREQRQQPIV